MIICYIFSINILENKNLLVTCMHKKLYSVSDILLLINMLERIKQYFYSYKFHMFPFEKDFSNPLNK